jgi:hypothetical protein
MLAYDAIVSVRPAFSKLSDRVGFLLHDEICSLARDTTRNRALEPETSPRSH